MHLKPSRADLANLFYFILVALRKAIMARSRLRNADLRSKSFCDYQAYRKQRNFVCKLNNKTRGVYFDLISSSFFLFFVT